MVGYLIVRRSGGGFFSIVATVLAHCAEAEKLGLVPWVDLETFPTPYQEENELHGTRNVWEYYFVPVARLTRDTLRDAQVTSEKGFPSGYPDSLVTDPIYKQMWHKYCILNQRSRRHISKKLREFEPNSSTLGVHFRGQEQRTASRHPLPPTLRQMVGAIDHAMQAGSYERILLATEGQQYVDFFRRRYKGRISVTPTFRLRYQNAYKLRKAPRENHRYSLGLETLTDAYLLGSCGGLVGCNSNLTDASSLIGDSNHSLTYVVNNGFNSPSPIFKKVNWYLKATLPSFLGGFKSWSIATQIRFGQGVVETRGQLP